MTDKEIVDALLNRNERVTKWFFWEKYRPLFINIIKMTFDFEVDYDECITELYHHIMKNDESALRTFQGKSTLGQWIKCVAIRFFRSLEKRRMVIEDESKEPQYEKKIEDEDYDDSESKLAAKIDVERLFIAMKNKRYIMVIQKLVLEGVEPAFLAKAMNIEVSNLYNIKKRALMALADVAINDKKRYENK